MLGSAIRSVWILQVLLRLVTAAVPQGFECGAVPGNYSLPGHCGAYVECLEGRPPAAGETTTTTTLTAALRYCGADRAYCPHLRRCLHHTMVKGCNRTVRQHDWPETYDPSLDHLCADAADQYVCADCKTLVNCVGGRAHATRCRPHDYCLAHGQAFGGSVCYPGRPQACVCRQTDVFYRDAYDAEAFFRCDASREPVLHRCSVGYWFDAARVQCRSAQDLPSCTAPGTFALAVDCRRYYACVATTEGFLQQEFRCPGHHDGPTFYNERTGVCDDPCDWTATTGFECSTEGRFADPTDCRRFIVCTWDAERGAFRRVLRQCPEGFEWEQVLRSGAGHCTASSGTGHCTALTATRCTIPPDLCT